MTRALATELAIGIAARLEHILGVGEPDAPDGHVYHSYTTVFEEGCAVLWRMGLAEPFPQQKDTNFAPYFALASEADIRARLALDAAEGADLSDLVTSYIGLACDYGRTWLPSTRDPFEPPDWALAALEALCAAGYLDRDGTRLRWSDKIGPAMVRWRFWTEGWADVQALEDARLEEEAALAARDMPEFVRDAFAKGQVFAVAVVQRHWTGQGWVAEPGRRVGLSFAKKLAERLESRLRR